MSDLIQKIQTMAACGMEADKIALVLDIPHGELLQKFGNYIQTAEAEANAEVARSLYKSAVSGKSPQAAIFWLKSRAGWKDQDVVIENITLDTPREEIIKRIQELESQGLH